MSMEKTSTGTPAAGREKETGTATSPASTEPESPATAGKPQKEIGGRGGPDPTRYGDWEIAGRCVDF